MSLQKIPRLLDSETLKEVKIYKGDTRDLIFTLQNADGTVSDLSSLTASDFTLTANPEFGGVQIFQKAGAFVTDGTDGQIKFTLGPAQLAATVQDAILELVDGSGGVQRTHDQWIFNILDEITA